MAVMEGDDKNQQEGEDWSRWADGWIRRGTGERGDNNTRTHNNNIILLIILLTYFYCNQRHEGG